MKLDIQVSINLAVIKGEAQEVTLLNEQVFEAGDKADLMSRSPAQIFVFRNQDINLRAEVQRLIERAKIEYKNLWVRGGFKLEPGINRFAPSDWKVVDVSMQDVVYAAFLAADKHNFGTDVREM
jgi:hypothetical protein